ncbi:MAG: chorismate lyase [Zoogloeaceae bacterium]|jgi:chorismate--pyruvate lyase|nr:chorismate lyase [Zoogloeaceae bacterium]
MSRALLHWHPHVGDEAGALRSLLQERGSLTLRLRRAAGEFSVRCLYQRAAPVLRDEISCLKARAGEKVWTREVLLCCDGEPVVFAHSVMPCHPQHPFDRSFAALQSRSLGAVLFADPRIWRGPLEFCPLDTRTPLYRRAEAALPDVLFSPHLWARRSRFSHRAKDVLVTEVFLPAALHFHKLSRPYPC